MFSDILNLVLNHDLKQEATGPNVKFKTTV